LDEIFKIGLLVKKSTRFKKIETGENNFLKVKKRGQKSDLSTGLIHRNLGFKKSFN
jgi:hypothetical protein